MTVLFIISYYVVVAYLCWEIANEASPSRSKDWCQIGCHDRVHAIVVDELEREYGVCYSCYKSCENGMLKSENQGEYYYGNV